MARTTEDLEWLEVSGRLEVEGAVVSGQEAVRARLEELFEAWEHYRLEPQEIRGAGDLVVAIVREVARGRASGAEVVGEWGYVISVRDGKIARVEAHRDAEKALKAAGLVD